MKAGALLSVLLGLVVLTQATEILVNPELDGCENGAGSRVTSWTGSGGDLPHSAYPTTFTNTPPGDTCFAYFDADPLNTLTQTITVPTKGSFDFSGLVACCFGDRGDSCGYSLTINGNNVPLTGGSGLSAGFPCTFFPVTALGISLPAGTYDLIFTFSPVGTSQVAATKLSLVFVSGGSGDPHMFGFQGQVFDYIGEAGQVINLVSDPELQMNSLLGLMKAGDVTFIDGPVMMEMAFMTRGHTVSINAGGYHKEEIGFVTVDGVVLPLGQSFLDGILSVSFTVLNTSSKDLGLTGDDHIVAQVDVKLEGLYEFRVFMIENGRDAENADNWLVKYPRRFLDFNASLLDHDRRPHGILGQTAAPLGKERSLEEWTIEGKGEDYVVKDGLTGTLFSFNQFQ